jgi:hypothetical protein
VNAVGHLFSQTKSAQNARFRPEAAGRLAEMLAAKLM